MALPKHSLRTTGHELRNSLTPMSSMVDTLLCSDILNEAQTRKVLSRIRQRSDRLMAFIEQYTQLSVSNISHGGAKISMSWPTSR
tara:strand:+ start:5630 stop:5884 length:255 start_codon:yes stop_codon:yes gene_type:complete